jgi:phage terminase Nu1 subunit (DNA packaging protein)
MDSEITSSVMQKLIGVNKVTLNDLAKRGVVMRGERKGTYKLAPSVSGYCEYLRAMAARRGDESGAEARTRLRASS